MEALSKALYSQLKFLIHTYGYPWSPTYSQIAIPHPKIWLPLVLYIWVKMLFSSLNFTSSVSFLNFKKFIFLIWNGPLTSMRVPCLWAPHVCEMLYSLDGGEEIFPPQ